MMRPTCSFMSAFCVPNTTLGIHCPKQKALDTVVMLSPASSLSQGQKHKGRVPAVMLILPAYLTCSIETMCHDPWAKGRGHDVLFRTSIVTGRRASSSHTSNRPALNRSSQVSKKCRELPDVSEGCLASHTPPLIKAGPLHWAMLTSC